MAESDNEKSDKENGSAESPNSRETRATRSRPALRTALLTLLEEKTFEQVTIRELTTRAGLSYPTFFRHYADQDALLNDVAVVEIRELLAMTAPIVYTVNTRASAEALCAYVWEHRKLWTALLTGGAARKLKDDFVREAAKNSLKNPKLDSAVPSELRVVVPVAGALEILAWWLRQPDPPPVRRVAQLLDDLVIAPGAAFRKLARDE